MGESTGGPPVRMLSFSSLFLWQKIVHKGDECILKDNNERSKWYVTGPGGVDMLVPSVGLIIPPPNPLAVDLSCK